MTTARTLGHLALYYRPGDEKASRLLLEDLGCTLVDNGPRPGADGFCTVLVDDETANHADNILFLAPLSPVQEELEAAIREQFGLGGASPDRPATAFTDMKRNSPETASHFAIRYRAYRLERVDPRAHRDPRGAHAFINVVRHAVAPEELVRLVDEPVIRSPDLARARDLGPMHEQLGAGIADRAGHPEVIRMQVRDEGGPDVRHGDRGVGETGAQHSLRFRGVHPAVDDRPAAIAFDQIDVHRAERWDREGEHEAPDARRDVLDGRHADRMVGLRPVRLAAQDTALSRQRPPVRIRYGLQGISRPLYRLGIALAVSQKFQFDRRVERAVLTSDA